MNFNITVVVVTYNRLELLKENIKSLLNQTYTISKIIIVNNNSTDGTKDYLDQLDNSNNIFTIINLDKNIGGAGGFSEGIRQACNNKCDWVWVMDDDTIPNEDALEKLINKINIYDKIGFLGSSVLFTDNKPHLMNNVNPSNNNILNIQWNTYIKENVLSINFCSFVSCLINFEAIKEVGLPYKEFFIWGDDKEYTERIIHAGYYGGLVIDSIVYHKTKNNYNTDLKNSDDSVAWKFFYDERNKVFMSKKGRGKLSFIHWYLFEIRYVTKILRKIKNNKKLKREVRKGLRAGLTFNPKIDYL